MKKIHLKPTLSIAGSLLLAILPTLSGSTFSEETYEALGGNANNDNLSDAINVLSGAIALSETGRYRAVVRCGAGSATWIGNSSSKSYFITVAHVVNAASNTITTYDGTVISPASGSEFYTAFNDFGLLEYDGVLNPNLFGSQSAVLMDENLVDNYLGDETTLVGYGNLTIGNRALGRTRCLSTAFITLEANERTRSDPEPGPGQPFAGASSAGDSGGGVFLNIGGTSVLIGAASSGNSTLYNYAHVFAHKDLINSIVPDGVFTWFSEMGNTFVPDPTKIYHIENPRWGLRLAANGSSQDAYTVADSNSGVDTQWKFTQHSTGNWHIDRAAGGSVPRLRTDNSSNPDMQETRSRGAWTYYEITPSTTADNTFYLTLPDGPSLYQRLRILSNGSIDFNTVSNRGVNPSLRFVEVSGSSGSSNIVSIVKRTASFGLHSNDGSNGGALNIHSNISHNNLKFKEIDRGGGYYSYERFNSAHSIDGGNGGGINQNVYVWSTSTNNHNQHWQKVSAGDGSFTLRKRNSITYGIHAGGQIRNFSNANMHSNLSHQNLHWFIQD